MIIDSYNYEIDRIMKHFKSKYSTEDGYSIERAKISELPCGDKPENFSIGLSILVKLNGDIIDYGYVVQPNDSYGKITASMLIETS